MAQKSPLYILGDSISIHYGPYLDRILGMKGKYRGLLRLYPENTSNSEKVKELLLSDVRKFPGETIIWNSGLHDVRRNREDRTIYTSMEDYMKNLEGIHDDLENKGFRQIFVNTTPVFDDKHNEKVTGWLRKDLDVRYYNDRAAEVMERLGVPLIDLYNFTLQKGEESLIDHVHFTPEVRAEQAQYISECLDRIDAASEQGKEQG